jgi:flagellar biosynthesis/type III secretory pathway protein FliH
MLGYNDATRASASTSEYIFAKWTLEPLATKYFEQLNEFLVPRYGDDLWLWYEPLAQKDEEAETNRKTASWNKWKTTNEIRAEEGLEPVNGGDQIYMGMSNMPLIGNNPPAPKKSAIELQAKDVLDVDLKTQKYIKKRIMNRNVRLKNIGQKAVDKSFDAFIEKKKIVFKIVPEKKGLSDDQIDAFYKSRMNEEAGLEGLWQKTFTDFFEKQEQRFLTALEEGKKDLAADYGINAHNELKATIDIINPLLYQTVMQGTKQASELIGEPSIIDMDFIKAWLADVAAKTGESINSTTIEAFEKALKAGIANGESLGELKARVEEVFTSAKGYRAEMIARTETARGVTEAHRKMYEYYGFEDVKWLLSPGACEECVVKSSDKWNVKSIEGQIPVHPNCKCDYTPL